MRKPDLASIAGRLLRAQLRVKVMAGVVLVTLVALAAFDVGALTVMKRNLLGQTDVSLKSALQHSVPAVQSVLGQVHGAKAAPVGAGWQVSATGGKPAGPAGQGPRYVPVGTYNIYYIASNGRQVEIQASSSVPGLGMLLASLNARLAAKPGLVTVAARSNAGGLVRGESVKVAGGTLVASTSLRQVDATINYIAVVVAAGSGIVLVVIGLGVYLVLRRGLRPVEAMATQADRITAGDLTRRVSSRHPRSEVGRLGLAVNGMLGRIQASVEERAAGERQMRRFFADASHELRTPLASLRANAELYMLGAVTGGAELDEVMRRITLEAKRMSGLVDDMFRLARLGAQPARAHEPVDLTSLINSCAERAVVAAPAHAWRLDVAPGLFVAGDEELLRRAIDNLITNVRVHTPEGTVAVISAAGQDSRVAVEVSDDGPGVPGDQLPHIFERFYRAAVAWLPGSGLGLAIVSEIAAAHGGRALATSQEGTGLRVTLDLPLLGCSQDAGTLAVAGNQGKTRTGPDGPLLGIRTRSPLLRLLSGVVVAGGERHEDRGDDQQPHHRRDPEAHRVPGDVGGRDDQRHEHHGPDRPPPRPAPSRRRAASGARHARGGRGGGPDVIGVVVRDVARQVGQVVEQAPEVPDGLGRHGAADPLVEFGLVEAAVGEVP
ncbi:MAG TPA: HAMP domain-containing sensor histidine kinase [Trebonia sp.]|nr:HAMP domain-containing sensor histidine kinase [Trebonia sp.]